MNSITGKNPTRRNFLSATVSTLAITAGAMNARAADSNVEEILRLYGRRQRHSAEQDRARAS